MASLTSFESYFSDVFASIPQQHTRKATPASSAKQPSAETPGTESDINTGSKLVNEPIAKSKDDPTNNLLSSKMKMSAYKLEQRQKHRKNAISSRKSELKSNLESLGFDPSKMSLMKQQKLLDKAMKDLSAKKKQSEADAAKPKEEDPLSFMADNDMQANDDQVLSDSDSDMDESQPETQKSEKRLKQPKTETAAAAEPARKRRKRDFSEMLDLEFADVVKPTIDREVNEERFIRTGKSSKVISDRHLLRQLKKRDKAMKRRYGQDEAVLDAHVVGNMVSRLKGEKVTAELKYLKLKMKKRHKKKVKSQRDWKNRVARKSNAKNRKLDRREANIESYRQKKTDSRLKNRITTEQALAAADAM